MPKLPVVSGIKVVKALSKIGYEIDRQTGSHIIHKNAKTSTFRCWMKHFWHKKMLCIFCAGNFVSMHPENL